MAFREGCCDGLGNGTVSQGWPASGRKRSHRACCGTGSEALLMDVGDGIKAAAAVGANVIRTPGIYRLAKERGFVKAVRPKLEDLRKAGFWLRDEHYRMVLENLGE